MINRPEIMEGIRRHIQHIGGQENLKILEIKPGHARLSIEVPEEALNLYGNAHGGFLFSLCDIAAGMSTYAYEVTNVTQCAGINFVRVVNSGTIYVESNTCLLYTSISHRALRIHFHKRPRNSSHTRRPGSHRSCRLRRLRIPSRLRLHPYQ